jgi:hypothetical protein
MAPESLPHAVDAALARHVLYSLPPARERHLDGRFSCFAAVGPAARVISLPL